MTKPRKAKNVMFLACSLWTILAMPFCARADALGIQDAVSNGLLSSILGVNSSHLVETIGNGLTAVDELYGIYDTVQNTITQIENQYKQIQLAVESAKNIDWENIKFDGDFDIRDEIKDANKRVNRLLNQARSIKSALTTSIINLPGGTKYSLADMCGFGDESKDLFTASADIYGYMSGTVKNAVKTSIGKADLTEKQQRAIFSKYGISPANYYFLVQTENQMRTAIANTIAWTLDKAKEMEVEQTDNTTNAIVSAAQASLDENGNMTQGATNEAVVLLLRNLSSQLSDLKMVMREAAGVSSHRLLYDLQEKEAKASQKYAKEKMDNYTENKVPASFTSGRSKKRKVK